jgi:type IV fimbrial biogenesis protein FimT
MDSAHSRPAFAHVGFCPVRGRFDGFTLTEVLIVLAVVSVLASIAAPSFSSLMAAQRTRAGATDLYLALAKARSEAVKRNASITLSKKGANWQDGWEILHPTDNTIKLEDHNAIAGISVTGPASVVYLPTGRVRGTTRPAFDFSVSGTSAAACVTVDLSGLPTQKSSPC